MKLRKYSPKQNKNKQIYGDKYKKLSNLDIRHLTNEISKAKPPENAGEETIK